MRKIIERQEEEEDIHQRITHLYCSLFISSKIERYVSLAFSLFNADAIITSTLPC